MAGRTKVAADRDFVRFCRYLYEENCYERFHHGQTPYTNFEIYFTKNEEWLQDKFKEGNGLDGSRERN